MERMRFKPVLLGAAFPLLLTACDEDWIWSEWLSGERDRGEVSVSLAATADGRDDREQIRLRINAVELYGGPDDDHRVEFNPPEDVDLLGGTQSIPLVDRETIQGGDFDGIRLHLETDAGVEDSYVEVDGTPYPLSAPQGVQAHDRFNLSTETHTRITVHIDLRQSLIDESTPNDQPNFQLDPHARVVVDDDSYTLSGDVSENVAACWDNSPPEPEDRAVYLFRGTDTTPHDMRSQAVTNRLVATAPVLGTNDDYRYRLPFLPEGDYTLAFTCVAGNDQPRQAGDIDPDDFEPVDNIENLDADREHDLN